MLGSDVMVNHKYMVIAIEVNKGEEIRAIDCSDKHG